MTVKRNFNWTRAAILAVPLILAGIAAVLFGAPHIDKENKGGAPRPAPYALAPATFVTADEQPVTLADFQGGVILVNLWATWCPPCVAELPSLDALQARMKGKEFKIVAVSMDSGPLSQVQAFLKKQDIENLDLYWDRDKQIMAKWKYAGLPVSFLVNREGDVVDTFEGPQVWDKGAVFDRIAEEVGR